MDDAHLFGFTLSETCENTYREEGRKGGREGVCSDAMPVVYGHRTCGVFVRVCAEARVRG